MLLFSAMLDIEDTLTKDKFIGLIIEWNQANLHIDNIIPDLVWNGERNVSYGRDGLWLCIREYAAKNIIAVRYESTADDGSLWDVDFVMSFSEMRLAVQVYRRNKDNSDPYVFEFFSPHFLTLLIENRYIKKDGELPVLYEPIYIRENRIPLLAAIINGEKRFKLPVIYISKTLANRDPFSASWLSRRLKGVAHVLVEEDKELDYPLSALCGRKNEFNGNVGIYYFEPKAEHKRFKFHKRVCQSRAMLDRIIREVFRHINSEEIDGIYTWQGVNNMMLADRLDAMKRNADEESGAVTLSKDEYGELLKQTRELIKRNEALEAENRELSAKADMSDRVVLTVRDENDFYEGEIKDAVLSSLEEVLSTLPKGSRRADLLKDILKNSDYERLGKQIKQRLERLTENFDGATEPLLKELKELGFEIQKEGRRYKLTYFADERYCADLSCSPNGKGVLTIKDII